MRILIIEDEHKIANSIKKGLEQENYTIDVAYSGTEGYTLATSDSYALIILDRMLPEMDGIEICRRLRANKNHTPVLMLTARGLTTDKIEGLDIGADDYMTKPFAFNELLARIRALTRRPRKTASQILHVADLSLNTRTFEVKRGERRVSLSSKEYALLEFLMRHAYHVLTKDQIINHVWSYDADVLPNSVEVYIKHLRDKIDKPFATPLIYTVRGFGYKIGNNHV
jgi:DNA-binding response OmpR family regulator